MLYTSILKGRLEKREAGIAGIGTGIGTVTGRNQIKGQRQTGGQTGS